ncbi:protein MpLEA-like11 [Marchantia polymorpha subsp. ruderalis]|uniref:Late embryogenesis abundant protein LEA-2 subgroup domain-containing protein n=2 Tax=Marchantia polymorpha TaxID=3197 RepID=A0AAF6AWL4_MARPO|nr:hypothetical protein MARPO_0007s0205 [Marchantia polymorpha]BBN04148.1 hypothetical protein Mp_3g02160 [Marchantia polymorpha subsp. ruderalis]|eukprot:PTQ47835.1 hypothetical protein MARPO_0007s0205 [Marchantia polymorpha]
MGEGKMEEKANPSAPGGPQLAPPAYYGLKDQPLPYPATYQPKKRRNPCCCCFKWFCSILVILIVALGIAALIFWLVVRPKLPEYDVTNVRLTGLDTSVTSSQLNTQVAFTLDTYNPNKRMGFYYDDFYIEVKTLDLVLGKGSLPSFYQGHQNRTIVESVLQSDTIVLTSVDTTLLTSASASKMLLLYVKVDVNTRIKVGDFKTNKIKVKVRCVVEIDPTISTGSQILNNSCKVKT